MKYHRLRPDEYFVLEQLDGERTLEEIRLAYEDAYRPQKVTTAELNQLVFRFHQISLTISDVALQGDRLRERAQKEIRQKWIGHLSGLLFIRFPGVDPEPLLKRLYPLVRPFLGRFGTAAFLLTLALAAAVFVIHFDTFAAQFPAMGSWIRLEAMLVLACVIGVTKVLHELGHAIMCKHFGGECHQIGPMLLVFTPALYCDTSDSWMLPSRFQRAAVGLAGIATEVFLASIATLVWASTAPGMVHYVAMNVMLVCSVSTVLFNANPLLRYDGYFVLSDLVDVPNLGEKSRRLLSGHANRALFGVDELTDEPMSGFERVSLLVYAVAAFVYRWSLTLAILWLVATLLRPYGLESVGRVLCAFAAGGMLFATLRGPFKFFRNPARRKNIRMNRLMITTALTAALVAFSFVPLPSGVSSTAKIVPRNETPIYVATAGTLSVLEKRPGDAVQQGEVIARLENSDIEMQFQRIQGRHKSQTLMVESMKRAAFDVPEIANELPMQESLLQDLTAQLATHSQRRSGLAIKATSSGRLIAAPHRAFDSQSAVENRLISWSGFPTDAKNDRCYLESGHELMTILGDDAWDAEIVLQQSQVERIAVGAKVKMVLETMPSEKFSGTVVEIAHSEWDEIQNADRRDDVRAARSQNPLETSYVVRVELGKADNAPLITGAMATTRIDAAPVSIVGRASRWLSGLLRFR
ncbi:putative peptide zinc metalloprotease protein YydH [Rubripirellula tenax]|uniref:Putative peptide zinc metalloprotease protein YydH n=1 Tax=Rubripirellula tenax TaxID=2528015 RepID=A0A5C6E4F4_9BACT|nr:M50 family metallopeptidase [Rubripirellula tenax]TWU44533.1 putative peptide zinc metalloprotease protein YydH [Rubripirellula tenax]